MREARNESKDVLITNLKLFYQCPTLWVCYLAVVGMFVPIGLFGLGSLLVGQKAAHVSNLSCGLLMTLAFAIGMGAGLVQRSIASKLFAFCLPGYRGAVRRFLSTVGIAGGLVVIMAFWGHIQWSTWFADRAGAFLIAAFACGLTVCLAGAALGFIARSYWIPAGVTCLLFTFAMGADLVYEERFLAEELLVDLAPRLTLLGMVTACGFWWLLGNPKLFRSVPSRPKREADLAAQDTPEDGRGGERAVSARPGIMRHRLTDKFFLGVIGRCTAGSAAKDVWGTLYSWLLPRGGRRMGVLVGAIGLVSAVLAWYMPSTGPCFIANVAMCSGLTSRPDPIAKQSLFAGGRRAWFYATMTLAVTYGLIMMLSVVLAFTIIRVSGVPTLAEHMLSDIGQSHRGPLEEPMTLRAVLLMTALYPVGRALEIWLLGRKIIARLTLAILFVSAIILSGYARPWLLSIPPAPVAAVIITAWLVCAFAAYRIAQRGDLVKR